MKYCKKCHKGKRFNNFSKNIRSHDGLQRYCKQCNKVANKKNNDERRMFGPTINRLEKFCNDCKTYKAISRFGIKTSSADGYQSYCKPCWSKRVQRIQAKSKG
jgi:hypothetical protein